MLTIVVGGQFGSESKGAVSGRLCTDHHYDYAVRVGGPNAGHSVIGENGKKYALRQLPVAAVVDPDTKLVIAAGSEVDPAVLDAEVQELEADGMPVRHRLLIDQEATWLKPTYAAAETTAFADGRSTKKGIGAARAARAMRTASTVRHSNQLRELGTVCDTQEALARAVLGHDTKAGTEQDGGVFLEGTQGYGLGSHAGAYPDGCTSGDCKATDFMAAAGLPPVAPDYVWLTLRMHPIRIAGDSGPLHAETSWDAIGVPPEYTTVTKKVRRVGQFDWDLAARSALANRPGHGRLKVALAFVDYSWPDLTGVSGDAWDLAQLPKSLEQFVRSVEETTMGQVAMLGTGPATQIRLER